MRVLLNDLSLHGQFSSVPVFQDAIRAIMEIRNKMRQFGRELHCHRNVVCAQVTHELTMQQAIQQFNQNERRAVMGWLTQYGPFWEDERCHESGDYLEYQERVVTDTALGEAAYRCFTGSEYQLVSLMPSNWLFTPIAVVWHRANETSDVDVPNHWEINTLETALRAASPPVQSWEQLASVMQIRCTHLAFSADSFEPLRGYPFDNGAAHC